MSDRIPQLPRMGVFSTTNSGEGSKMAISTTQPKSRSPTCREMSRTAESLASLHCALDNVGSDEDSDAVFDEWLEGEERKQRHNECALALVSMAEADDGSTLKDHKKVQGLRDSKWALPTREEECSTLLTGKALVDATVVDEKKLKCLLASMQAPTTTYDDYALMPVAEITDKATLEAEVKDNAKAKGLQASMWAVPPTQVSTVESVNAGAIELGDSFGASMEQNGNTPALCQVPQHTVGQKAQHPFGLQGLLDLQQIETTNPDAAYTADASKSEQKWREVERVVDLPNRCEVIDDGYEGDGEWTLYGGLEFGGPRQTEEGTMVELDILHDPSVDDGSSDDGFDLAILTPFTRALEREEDTFMVLGSDATHGIVGEEYHEVPRRSSSRLSATLVADDNGHMLQLAGCNLDVSTPSFAQREGLRGAQSVDRSESDPSVWRSLTYDVHGSDAAHDRAAREYHDATNRRTVRPGPSRRDSVDNGQFLQLLGDHVEIIAPSIRGKRRPSTTEAMEGPSGWSSGWLSLTEDRPSRQASSSRDRGRSLTNWNYTYLSPTDDSQSSPSGSGSSRASSASSKWWKEAAPDREFVDPKAAPCLNPAADVFIPATSADTLPAMPAAPSGPLPSVESFVQRLRRPFLSQPQASSLQIEALPFEPPPAVPHYQTLGSVPGDLVVTKISFGNIETEIVVSRPVVGLGTGLPVSRPLATIPLLVAPEPAVSRGESGKEEQPVATGGAGPHYNTTTVDTLKEQLKEADYLKCRIKNLLAMDEKLRGPEVMEALEAAQRRRVELLLQLEATKLKGQKLQLAPATLVNNSQTIPLNSGGRPPQPAIIDQLPNRNADSSPEYRAKKDRYTRAANEPKPSSLGFIEEERDIRYSVIALEQIEFECLEDQLYSINERSKMLRRLVDIRKLRVVGGERPENEEDPCPDGLEGASKATYEDIQVYADCHVQMARNRWLGAPRRPRAGSPQRKRHTEAKHRIRDLLGQDQPGKCPVAPAEPSSQEIQDLHSHIVKDQPPIWHSERSPRPSFSSRRARDLAELKLWRESLNDYISPRKAEIKVPTAPEAEEAEYLVLTTPSPSADKPQAVIHEICLRGGSRPTPKRTPSDGPIGQRRRRHRLRSQPRSRIGQNLIVQSLEENPVEDHLLPSRPAWGQLSIRHRYLRSLQKASQLDEGLEMTQTTPMPSYQPVLTEAPKTLLTKDLTLEDKDQDGDLGVTAHVEVADLALDETSLEEEPPTTRQITLDSFIRHAKRKGRRRGAASTNSALASIAVFRQSKPSPSTEETISETETPVLDLDLRGGARVWRCKRTIAEAQEEDLVDLLTALNTEANETIVPTTPPHSPQAWNFKSDMLPEDSAAGQWLQLMKDQLEDFEREAASSPETPFEWLSCPGKTRSMSRPLLRGSSVTWGGAPPALNCGVVGILKKTGPCTRIRKSVRFVKGDNIESLRGRFEAITALNTTRLETIAQCSLPIRTRSSAKAVVRRNPQRTAKITKPQRLWAATGLRGGALNSNTHAHPTQDEHNSDSTLSPPPNSSAEPSPSSASEPFRFLAVPPLNHGPLSGNGLLGRGNIAASRTHLPIAGHFTSSMGRTPFRHSRIPAPTSTLRQRTPVVARSMRPTIGLEGVVEDAENSFFGDDEREEGEIDGDETEDDVEMIDRHDFNLGFEVPPLNVGYSAASRTRSHSAAFTNENENERRSQARRRMARALRRVTGRPDLTGTRSAPSSPPLADAVLGNEDDTPMPLIENVEHPHSDSEVVSRVITAIIDNSDGTHRNVTFSASGRLMRTNNPLNPHAREFVPLVPFDERTDLDLTPQPRRETTRSPFLRRSALERRLARTPSPTMPLEPAWTRDQRAAPHRRPFAGLRSRVNLGSEMLSDAWETNERLLAEVAATPRFLKSFLAALPEARIGGVVADQSAFADAVMRSTATSGHVVGERGGAAVGVWYIVTFSPVPPDEDRPKKKKKRTYPKPAAEAPDMLHWPDCEFNSDEDSEAEVAKEEAVLKGMPGIEVGIQAGAMKDLLRSTDAGWGVEACRGRDWAMEEMGRDCKGQGACEALAEWWEKLVGFEDGKLLFVVTVSVLEP